MERAWIAGKPVSLESAIAEAARLLAASRQPLIAGLATDVAGARAAIMLAQRTGAIIDHMNSDVVLRNLDVMRSSGVMLTTPSEAYIRAETLLLAGEISGAGEMELVQRLFRQLAGRNGRGSAKRRVFWLCPGGDLANRLPNAIHSTAIGKQQKHLPALLAALRARIAGRPMDRAPVAIKVLDDVSAALKGAQFGVAIWSAEAFDALAIEMLCGLIGDLNATTRFSGLPLAPGNNAIGVLQTCGWMTGMPMRTSFGRGFPEHDPWLFDSRHVIDKGETDCVVWISNYRDEAPGWRDPLPIIALTGRDASFGRRSRVHIEVGRPGIDHDAVEHLSLTGTLAAVEATQPSDAISTAEAITRIISALPGDSPC
jgi:formylmethanofuran dehydrogenase subunit B